MLYREIIAVCSEIHKQHTNTLSVQNVELLNVKLAVHVVTTGGTYSDHCAVHIVTTGLCKVTRSAVAPSRLCVSQFSAFCSTQLYIFAT